MKRLLTSLLVLLVVLYLGFRAAVWWLTDQRMAEARSALEKHGVLERGTISSGLGGQLVLGNAYWQDFRLTRPLEFSRLEFDAGSPLTLLQTLADPATLPASWTLRAEGVGLQLDATLFRNWVTADGRNNGGAPALVRLPCTVDTHRQLAGADLIRMGITRLAGDMLIRQDVQGLHAELDLSASASLYVNWPGLRLALPDPQSLLRELAHPLRLTLRDGGLMRRLSAYCARESGLDEPAWAARAGEALARDLHARGVRASAPLLALYRRWLLEGGELSMALHPREPWWGIPVRDESGDSGDWAVTYNGEVVPDLYLEPVPVPVVQAATAAPQPEVDKAESPEHEGWYTHAPEDVDAWLGYRVRVTLNNGKVVEGRLESTDEQALAVARPVAGGEVVYPILRRALSQVEIWRRGRPDGGADPPGGD